MAGARFEKAMLKMTDAFEARAKNIKEGNTA
jgi:ribosome-associated toxin RatA of RatAB toxin-antitoxin module